MTSILSTFFSIDLLLFLFTLILSKFFYFLSFSSFYLFFYSAFSSNCSLFLYSLTIQINLINRMIRTSLAALLPIFEVRAALAIAAPLITTEVVEPVPKIA
jgi:hypothetical protein